MQENNLSGNKIANINEIDFSNRLEEILKQDTFKLLINISSNIMNNHIMKNYCILIQRLSSNKTIEIINKRKNFIYLEKLLILRNILLHKDKNLNLIIRFYFYLWKRFQKINPINSFKRKLLIRNLINKKIKNKDYLTRLIRRAFFSLIEIHRNNPDLKNNKTKEFYIKEKHEGNKFSKAEDQDSKLKDRSSEGFEKVLIKDSLIDIHSINANVSIHLK